MTDALKCGALQCGNRVLDLASPCTMGILNITPDSFSDGGLFVSTEAVSGETVNLKKAEHYIEEMIAAGAAIIDIGGESTRPGAQAVTVEEERKRVLPFVEIIKENFPDCLISVDTSKPEIMADAIQSGAHIINDVNALQAPGAIETIASSDVAVCLMHMQGQPRTMQENPQYEDVVTDIIGFLQQRIEACVKAGISRNRLIIDPGFGFGKSLQHNLQLMKSLSMFKELGVALMVGVSRKSMIGALLNKDTEDRLSGSIGLAALAAWLGADILRVHDVEATSDVLNVIHAVRSAD